MFPAARRDPFRTTGIFVAVAMLYVAVLLALKLQRERLACRLAIVIGWSALCCASLLAVILGLLGVWAYRPGQYLALVIAALANALLGQMARDPAV
jgi:hypothetical protein